MNSKFVTLALSIVALSPLFISSLEPAKAQASTAQIQKTNAHISRQDHSKNVNATKIKRGTTAASKPTKHIRSNSSNSPIGKSRQSSKRDSSTLQKTKTPQRSK